MERWTSGEFFIYSHRYFLLGIFNIPSKPVNGTTACSNNPSKKAPRGLGLGFWLSGSRKARVSTSRAWHRPADLCFKSPSLPALLHCPLDWTLQPSKLPTLAYCCSLHLSKQLVSTIMSTPERSTPVTNRPLSQVAKPQRVLACVLCQQRKVKCELFLHSFAAQPHSCTNVCINSSTLIWQIPISRVNSNLACSLKPGMVFVTQNILLTISWLEYPRSPQIPLCQLYQVQRAVRTRRDASPPPASP